MGKVIIIFFYIYVFFLPAFPLLAQNTSTVSDYKFHNSTKEMVKEYYELDYRIKEWDRIRQQSGKVVIPENFERDIARWNQLSAQLGIIKAKQAADIAAEDNTKNVLLAGIGKRGKETTEVGIMGPPSPDDEVEQNMYRYFGQRANLDYVLLVNTKEQFFRDLEKIAKDGKKINYLIIAGHGESYEPHVALGSETILPVDVDIAFWSDQLKDMSKRRADAWKEKCRLQRKGTPTPEDKARLERLSKNLELQDNKIKDALQQLALFDAISDIMAENAVILLINCSPAATEKGLAFVRNLGRIFLGRNGGKVIASTVDVSVDQVTRLSESILVWFGSSEKTRDAAWKEIGQFFIMGEWKEIDIPGNDLWPPVLPVSFKVPCIEAAQGASVTLECLATGWKDSGKLVYHWNQSASGTAQASFSLEVQDAGTDLLVVEVLVKDERGRQGTDTAYVSAKPLSIKIDLSDSSPPKDSSVTARATFIKGKKPGGASWYWKADGGLRISSQGKEEISVDVRAEGLLTLQLVDIGPFGKMRVLGQATARIQPRDDASVPPVVAGKWKFSGVSPGNWTVGYNKKGLVMERKPAKNKFPCGESSVTAELWAEFPAAVSGKDDPKSAADCLAAAEKSFKSRRQGNTPNDMAVGLFLAGGVEGANSFSLGDFQGAMADFALWMRRGSGSPWSGYTGSYFGANGSGCAVKENMLIRFGYRVWGNGCWDNSDRAYLITQGVAAQAEARAILASLRVGPDGEIKQEPYKGPNYDGSDLPKVTLSPPKLEKLRLGDTVKVTAEVHNDKPEDSPFTYNWGGTFDGKPEDAKKKAAITIKPQKPGKYDLSVSVDGQRFNMGSASLQYEVADYKVKIERVPADMKPVPVGVKTGFKAILTMDGKPASGTFIYRWQPHPEVIFDKLDSNAPNVNASFPKPGKVKVWVQVLENRDGREATVAESAQLEIEVIKPQLELSFEPKEPFVGQELKAKLTVKPEVKEIDFRWMPVPDNARQTMESKDGREITLYLKDDKPTEIHVMARVPKSGEDLGEAKNIVKAKKYAVNVTGPKAMGPKPKVWKEGVGLVDVENAIAVDQIVEFSADVQPQPQTAPVKYEWRVRSGPCRVSNPIVREARVTAGEAGSCDLVVVVRDRNDVELGTGAGSFSATVTREAIQQGQQKAKDITDAKAKLQSAMDKARQGKLDEAIAIAKEAAQIDNTAQPVLNSIATTVKNTGWDALNKGDYKLAIKRLEQAVDLNPSDTDAQKKLKEARDYQSKMPQIEAKMREFDTLIAQKKIVSSYQKLLEIQDILRTIGSSGQSAYNPVIIKYNKDYNELNKWYNELIQKTNAEWTRLFQQKDWNNAEKLLTEVLKYEHTEANKKNYESSLQMVRGFIAESNKKKQRADQLWDECAALARQNKLNEALSKCKESLNHWSSDNRISATKDLESTINQATQKKAISDRLWDECAALEKQGRNQEALKKCRESLNYWSSEKRVAVVKELENTVKQTTTIQPPIAPGEQPVPQSLRGFEWDIDRLGSDYSNFDLPVANPQLCKDACDRDPKCKAWTYVKPNTIQGPRPRCWLKYAVPNPLKSTCCVSGVKGIAAPQPSGRDYTPQPRTGRDYTAQPPIAPPVTPPADSSGFTDSGNITSQEEQKKAAANRLWDECSALAKQNRLNEALSKCKESLNHWSSEKRVTAVKNLENTIKQTTAIQPKPGGRGGWYLVEVKQHTPSNAGLHRGVAGGQVVYDFVGAEGGQGNLTITMWRAFGPTRDSGLILEFVSQMRWDDPPDYLEPGQKVSFWMSQSIPEGLRTDWTTASASFDVHDLPGPGMGTRARIIFVKPDGDQIVRGNFAGVLQSEQVIPRGSQGDRRAIWISLYQNYGFSYQYEWRE